MKFLMKIAMRLNIFQVDNISTIIQLLLAIGENDRIQNHPQAENRGNYIF